MAKKYKAQVSPRGLLIRSEDGQEEIHLDPELTRQLGLQIFQVLGPSKTLQRSTAPVRRSASTPQRSTAPVVQFVGKASSGGNPLWEQYARDRAKRQAMKQYHDHVNALAGRGKFVSNAKASGQWSVSEGGD